jgi:Zn finger protein HypA/HybF involved in hydrogenase expression
MIIANQAVLVNDEVVDPKHVVEILCPNCDRDIDEAELAAKKCNDCGHDLSTPAQHVSIFATSQPIGGKVWGE